MKVYKKIIPLLFLASCLGGGETPQVVEDHSDKTTKVEEKSSDEEPELKSDIKIKTFTQYNMTLSKLTGIHRSQVSDTFNKVKNSLPSGNEASLYNSFTQISFTRLATDYCALYVESDHHGIDFENDSVEEKLKKLKDRFLDVPPSSNPSLYGELDMSVSDVLSNSPMNDFGDRYVAIVDNNGSDYSVEDINKRLVILGCVVILSSSHVTMM